MALEPGDHYFTTGHAGLQYRVGGSGPLLIVQPPGWGIGAAPYQETLRPLEEVAKVVYLQPRGAAGVKPSPGESLNVQAFVEDLEQLRIHLNVEQFHLLGHSHGGLIALHYASAYPERLSSLIALNAQLVGLPPEPATGGGQSEPALEQDPPEVIEALDYMRSVGGFGAIFSLKVDEEATEFLRRIFPLYFRDFSNARVLEPILSCLSLPLHTLQTVSSSDEHYPLDVERLRALPMPVLVVAGAYDRVCPVPSRRRLAKLLIRGRFILFEKSGHFPWLEEAEKFFRSVGEFIEEASNTAPNLPT